MKKTNYIFIVPLWVKMDDHVGEEDGIVGKKVRGQNIHLLDGKFQTAPSTSLPVRWMCRTIGKKKRGVRSTRPLREPRPTCWLSSSMSSRTSSKMEI